jgi:hypothetical protein
MSRSTAFLAVLACSGALCRRLCRSAPPAEFLHPLSRTENAIHETADVVADVELRPIQARSRTGNNDCSQLIGRRSGEAFQQMAWECHSCSVFEADRDFVGRILIARFNDSRAGVKPTARDRCIDL